MEIKRIETYSLYEFCQAVQQNIVEGWRFDFQSNENFPTAFGSMLVAGMVKDAVKPVALVQEIVQDNTEVIIEDDTEVIIEDDAEIKSEIKRGRKARR